MRVWMMRIVEFDDLESAHVHVEVNVPPVEIRSSYFPNLRGRMSLLDFEPGTVSNTVAMHMGRNEKKGERIFLRKLVEHHYGAAHPFPPAIIL